MAATSLPPFLTQRKSDLHTRFVDLEWQQRNRLLLGTQDQPPPSGSALANVDPYTFKKAKPHEFSRLVGPGISERNRYMNVEPYATNRIKLKVVGGTNGEETLGKDYINASPVVLGEDDIGGERRYIATQGPKNTGINHFYRMVSEIGQDEGDADQPVVVVMLTQTHEAGKEKCFQYYPLSSEDSPLRIEADSEMGDGYQGEVVLESVEQDDERRCEVRRMTLRTQMGEDGEWKERTIRHLLFSAWPDFLVPEGDDRDALVRLVGYSAELNKDTKTTDAKAEQHHPRIIHCSAGVGRSGTFIALDYLLSLLHGGHLERYTEVSDEDPVADTVDRLRQQRMMMVQGEGQFMFLYEVLREAWQTRHWSNGSNGAQSEGGASRSGSSSPGSNGHLGGSKKRRHN